MPVQRAESADSDGAHLDAASARDATLFEVRRGAIAANIVDDALRLLHLDLLQRGASAHELGEWLWSAHWFPHLRHHEAIAALADALPPAWRSETRCDPQILLQFPHSGPEPEITFHVDREPGWANGRPYKRIVGVALSQWRAENGGLILLLPDGPHPIALDPGDAVMMTPGLPHSGGINRTGTIRYGVYFRWLESRRDVVVNERHHRPTEPHRNRPERITGPS